MVGNCSPLVEYGYWHLQTRNNEGEQNTFIVMLLNQQSESVLKSSVLLYMN